MARGLVLACVPAVLVGHRFGAGIFRRLDDGSHHRAALGAAALAGLPQHRRRRALARGVIARRHGRDRGGRGRHHQARALTRSPTLRTPTCATAGALRGRSSRAGGPSIQAEAMASPRSTSARWPPAAAICPPGGSSMPRPCTSAVRPRRKPSALRPRARPGRRRARRPLLALVAFGTGVGGFPPGRMRRGSRPKSPAPSRGETGLERVVFCVFGEPARRRSSAPWARPASRDSPGTVQRSISRMLLAKASAWIRAERLVAGQGQRRDPGLAGGSRQDVIGRRALAGTQLDQLDRLGGDIGLPGSAPGPGLTG